MDIPTLTRRRFVAGMGIGATSAVVPAACGESESTTTAESPQAAQEWGVRHLSTHDGDPPHVASPVYPWRRQPRSVSSAAGLRQRR